MYQMELQRVLLWLSLSISYVCCTTIPDKSLIMSTHGTTVVLFSGLKEWEQSNSVNKSVFFQINSTYLNNTKGVSFLYRKDRQLVLFSDGDLNHISVMNTSESKNKATVFHIGTSSGVGQLAVDWVSGNCYWVDTVYGWIVMQAIPKVLSEISSDNPNFKMVANSYLDMPTGIAVYPEMGYLFWTDTGKIPKIERSSLNGEDRKLLAWQGIIRPTSLCTDYSYRLYWTDLVRGTVESTDLHGNERNILVSSPGSRFYGIDIFQDKLVVSDLTNHPEISSIKLFSKADGRQTGSEIILKIPIFSIAVFDEGRQPLDLSQRCDSLDCQQLCIERPNSTGADCTCEDGFTLNLDGKTCKVEVQVLQNKIVYTNNSKICFVSINAITSHKILTPTVDCTVVDSSHNITKLAIDTSNRTFYFTDGHKIYYQRAFENHGSHDVYSTKREIIDLAYNWVTRTLYWFEWDTDGGVCYKTTDPDYDYEEFIHTAKKPITFAFNPYTQTLFWMALNKAEGKVMLHTTSSNGTTNIINSPIIQNPTDLEYDLLTDRLFWTDNGFIGQMKSDGTNEKKIDLDTSRKYQCLTVFKNYTIIGYSFLKDPNRSAFTIVQEGETMRYIDFELPNMMMLSEVKVYAEQFNKIEPCENNNGGCEQICLPGEKTTCSCHVGYTLNEDGKNCRTADMVKNFILVLDSIDRKAYQISLSDSSINTLRHVIGSMPSSINFDLIRQRIVWIDTYEKTIHHFQLGDKTVRAEKKDDINQFSHVAIDSSTGNFYVTLNNKIAVITVNLDVKILITTTSTPRKLIVFPKLGQMAWIEESKVRKAKMDGTEPNDFVTAGISALSDIAFDYEDEALYWSDGSLDKIVRIKLMQAESSDIITKTGEYPNNICVAGQFVYYTSYTNSRAIYRRNKMPGGKDFKVIFDSPLVGGLTSLFVYLEPHPCDYKNGGCDHICLAENSQPCRCYQGYKLNEDGMACSRVIEQYIIIGSAAGGGFLLLLIIVITIAVLCWRRKRQTQLTTERTSGNYDEPEGTSSMYTELSNIQQNYDILSNQNQLESGISDYERSDGAHGQTHTSLPHVQSLGKSEIFSDINPYKSKINFDHGPSGIVSEDYLTAVTNRAFREGPNNPRISHPEEDESEDFRRFDDSSHRYGSSGSLNPNIRYQPWEAVQRQARGNFNLPPINSLQNLHHEGPSRFQTQYRY